MSAAPKPEVVDDDAEHRRRDAQRATVARE
jgi:hypothetical protein